MPFLHMNLFWLGAAVASVPIIIHLLNRRRFKIRDWAAMKFLLESVRKNRRRVRLEELLLMALRTLAIVLLAMAVARFTGCSAVRNLPGATAAQTAHVFILDDSISMGQRLAEANSFARATTDLAGLLEAMPKDDRVAVLRTSHPARAEALCPLDTLTDVGSLKARILSLKPSDTTGGLEKALQSAGEILQTVEMQKRVYVLGDFRREDFTGASVEPIRKALEALNARITFYNYGQDVSAGGAGGNLTVEKIESLERVVIAGVPARVQLRVRNNGTTSASNVAVSFTVPGPGGEEIKITSKPVERIDAGGTALAQAACTFEKPGMASLKATLPADGLGGDNVAHLAVEVRAARQVLLVDGESDVAVPMNSETYFLAGAIDPTDDHVYGNAAEIVPHARLAEVDLNKYDMVILANVPMLPDDQLTALKDYVAGGGGLAIFTGDRVNIQYYQETLYEKGNGLAPARIGPPIVLRELNQPPVRLLPDSIANDPVVEVFQGTRSKFTQLIRFYAYNRVDEVGATPTTARAGAARVLARFNNTGEPPQHCPAIIGRPYGAGAVVMIASSADLEWTDWPKDYTFLPFVNDLLTECSRIATGNFLDTVGQPVRYTVGQDLAAATALLKTPSADFPPLEEEAHPDRRKTLAYSQAREAGLYELQLDLAGDQRRLLFARNIDPREGRLERMAQAELSEALKVPVVYVDKVNGAGAAPQEPPAREYWKLALAAMLVVLALEVFLGQRFGHYQS